jgi:MoaA/NifB/PqqE/SkfB family radical SAM enzyme
MPLLNRKALNIAKKYITGKFRCAEFALTNSCIAKCTFCNIWKQKPKIFVDKDKAIQAINRLADFGVAHICFTGGEALLHPNIIEIAEAASKRNIYNAVLLAAPQLLLRKDMIKQLENAGVDLISISYDSSDPAVMAESRQLPNIINEMEQAIKQIKSTSMKTMASVLIWKDNYDKLEDIFISARNMGYDFISLNYPTFSDSEIYELGGDGINFPKENLIEALDSAITLKEIKKYKIINTTVSMRNIIDYLKDPLSVKYHCFGGRRVMFVDWFFNVYPCMQVSQPLGNILTIEEKTLNIPSCNKCNMSWYRDMSLFFYGTRSIPVFIEAMKSSSKIL